MDDSAARAIIEETLDPMAHATGLAPESWRIHARVARLDDGAFGECEADAKYRKATLTFDAQRHGTDANSERELLHTQRHELIHCLLAPMNLYREAVQPTLSERENEIAEAAFEHAEEECVMAIERMLDVLGFTPAKLVQVGGVLRQGKPVRVSVSYAKRKAVPA